MQSFRWETVVNVVAERMGRRASTEQYSTGDSCAITASSRSFYDMLYVGGAPMNPITSPTASRLLFHREVSQLQG